MNATLVAVFMCECGSVMMSMDRPYNHLIHCCNPKCEHYGDMYATPTVPLERGKAIKTV